MREQALHLVSAEAEFTLSWWDENDEKIAVKFTLPRGTYLGVPIFGARFGVGLSHEIFC